MYYSLAMIFILIISVSTAVSQTENSIFWEPAIKIDAILSYELCSSFLTHSRNNEKVPEIWLVRIGYISSAKPSKVENYHSVQENKQNAEMI